MSWDQRLLQPITVPKTQKVIRTLADARAYILALPKKRQHDQDVQAAYEALLMAAMHPAALLHANVGIGRVVLQLPIPKRRRS